MPFLYPPDAVSLLLIWIALILLRQSAENHIRLELARLEHEAKLYWSGTGLAGDAPALSALLELLDSGRRAAGRMTPARQFFVRRCLATWRPAGGLADWLQGFEVEIGLLEDLRVADRLRRFRQEMESSLGVFYLLGSISGWCVFTCTAARIARRAFAHPGRNRIDWSMDLAERVFAREGRHALRLSDLSGIAR